MLIEIIEDKMNLTLDENHAKTTLEISPKNKRLYVNQFGTIPFLTSKIVAKIQNRIVIII